MIRIYFVISFILFHFTSFAQPVNDACQTPIDISDGLWHPGDTQLATYNCASDHRTGHCIAGGVCPTNAVDMCCGISGIESSIWYTFSIPFDDTVFVDFRNIVCNPASFFGNPTTLQGFALRRVNSAGVCSNPCLDTTKACFYANNTLDVDGQMTFEAQGGQVYYLEIDTEKNSFSGCGGCATPSPTCHANCVFEIRIRQANPTLPLVEMNVNARKSSIDVFWMVPNELNHSYYRVDRVANSEKAVKVLVQKEASGFQTMRKGYYCFKDTPSGMSDIYDYKLYGSNDGTTYEYISSRKVHFNPKGAPSLTVYPNPSKGIFSLSTEYMSVNNIYFKVYDMMGKMHKSGKIELDISAEMDISYLPEGTYVVSFSAGSEIFQQKVAIFR